jgi:signal transduction histidine kinase/CheY-like chemotaxis protein
MSQGITVIDNNQRLVAWNKRCIELFGYPENLFYVGNPIAELVRFNAQQESLTEDRIKERITEQLEKYTSQQSYVYKRISATQQVIEVRVEPIPNKGHVITYTDITSYQLMVDALKESNETLEQRVSQRTTQLTNINHRLGVAKSQAEAANQSKTRFLAAASHDLAQPLNAARLFVTALQHIDLPQDPSSLINNLSDSLQNAESLITELFDIAKIDAGVVKTTISHFPIIDVFNLLKNDFGVLAVKKNIDFRTQTSNLIVQTDSKLLLRILQNLLANALRYTNKGKVVIGCRRTKNSVKIEVWDTGIGILEKDTKDIFTEFKRISHSGNDEGSGLGLATVHRLCLLLNLPIEVRSTFGEGSGFKITVPRGKASKVDKPMQLINTKNNHILAASSLNILTIDNEEKILSGMQSLLAKWHHNVIIATCLAEAKANTSVDNIPDVILADYHLDNEHSGIDVVQSLFEYWGKTVPCIVISADQTEQVKAQSKALDFLFMQKPIKPLTLRAALSRFSAKQKP